MVGRTRNKEKREENLEERKKGCKEWRERKKAEREERKMEERKMEEKPKRKKIEDEIKKGKK